MDSILGDKFMNGRRMRPATLEYALANYPRVVIWMKLGKLDIFAPPSCEGNDVVEVRGKSQPIYHLVMVREDFEKCRAIAKQMTVPLFASEREQDWFDRARPLIRQAFGG